jgi:hypothetical protein
MRGPHSNGTTEFDSLGLCEQSLQSRNPRQVMIVVLGDEENEVESREF